MRISISPSLRKREVCHAERAWACGPPTEMKIAVVVTPA
jgi:hypothetical protein